MAKDSSINVRITKTDKTAFIDRCSDMNREYQNMIREMIEAFNEGRLRIVPTQDQKNTMEDLYL